MNEEPTEWLTGCPSCGMDSCDCDEGTCNPPAKQEPVAYLCENAVGHKYFRWKKPSSIYKPIALYTSPPAQRTWVGLTDKEKREARNAVSYSPLAMTMGEWTEAVQDATEAKLKEKNNG